MLSSAIFIILQNHKMIEVGKDLEDHEVFHPEGGDALEQVAQRRLWMPHPWRHSKPGWMWLWAAWSAGW